MPAVDTPSPRAITHVGLSVPDIDAAVAWYRDVLGFRVLQTPVLVDRSDPIAADVFGPRFGRMWIAHLASGSECALELFAFEDPAYEPPADGFRPWGGGFFHICVVDPEVAALAQRIAETGGRIRGQRVWRMALGDPAERYLTIYCEDPFGNIVEVFSHPHEEVYGAAPDPA